MNCDKFAALIDCYLNGDLSGEKQEAFELHYFECDHCYLQLKIAERLHSKTLLISMSGEKHKTIKGAKTSFLPVRKWKPVLAAASLFLVVLLSVFTVNHFNRSKMLYAISSFSPPVYIKSETRGSGESANSDKTFAKAMEYYNRKDYTRALEILRNIPGLPSNPQVIFFKGICFLLTDALRDAVKEFDIIIQNMIPAYYDEAIYYKAIALLRMNKKEEALEQLNHLAGMFSPYAPRARTLIEKITGM